MSAARSVTATYMAQYQLTLAITAGVPGGLGNITGGTNGTFYDDGTVLNLTAATPVAEGAGKQWRFTPRGGGATRPTSPGGGAQGAAAPGGAHHRGAAPATPARAAGGGAGGGDTHH